MQNITRRRLIKQLVVTGMVLSTDGRAETGSSEGGNREMLTGHVHALGGNPALFPAFEKGRADVGTVLSSIDLASGHCRQTLLKMAGGHMTSSLANGSILCVAHHKSKSMIVNKEHEVVAELTTGPDHLFGGHGWVDEARHRIVLPQRRRLALGTSDVGSLLIFDAKTFRLLDEVASGGIHPHELHPIPGTDELAVTHYGDIHARHAIFEHNVVDAKLSILDVRTLKPKRHYPLDKFNAMVTHMRVDPTGWAHLVLTQYINLAGGKAYRVAMAELEKAIGRSISFDIPQAALVEQLLPLPLPMLAIHTRTGERRIIDTGDQHHLRSQSVAYNTEAEAAVAVYSHSDNLVIQRRGQPAKVIPAQRLGLRDLRGVVDLPGTTRVAVMASYRNLAVYDILTDELVTRYKTQNYQDTHLGFQA
jgi:hypothetical protein